MAPFLLRTRPSAWKRYPFIIVPFLRLSPFSSVFSHTRRCVTPDPRNASSPHLEKLIASPLQQRFLVLTVNAGVV